jgi:hypothetical protein
MKQNTFYQQDIGVPPPPPPPPAQDTPPPTPPAPTQPVYTPAGAFDIQKMIGDMKFVGIFNVVMGAITCLSCIGAITGIPTIIAGLRLKDSAESFMMYSTSNDNAHLTDALSKQSRYFFILKVLAIITIVLVVLYFLFIIFYFLILGATLSTLFEK